MRIHHLATIGFSGLLAVLAVGCSRRTAEEEADVRKSFGVPADMPMKDLGAVELRAGIPKRVHVGSGKDCTFTATVLTNGLVRLNLLYESQGEVMAGAKPQSHSERSFVFRPRPGWYCFFLPPVPQPDLPRMGQHLVVAVQLTVIP